MFDLIIIGGCAAGLTAAISAKREHPEMSVALIEQLPKVGKKLLATGNGKCNITNGNIIKENYNNFDKAHPVLSKCTAENIIDFFNSIGILMHKDSADRYYPMSNSASSVVDALRYACQSLGIKIICNEKVTSIKKNDGVFVVNNSFTGKALIIATGSKASPSQGSDGSGYALAKSLGHKISSLYPSLVPLKSDDILLKSLKGVRVSDIKLMLTSNKNNIEINQGEILFSENGISGIAAMELAVNTQKCIDKNKNAILQIDLLPKLTDKQIINLLKQWKDIKEAQPIDEFLTGVLPKALGIAVLKKAGVYKGQTFIGQINDINFKKISETIKCFSIKLTGTKGFDCAQVTSGGIEWNEINEHTLQSKIITNLYFAGEILDVDGKCGGFNLQWAFSSGIIAGKLLK